MEEELERMHLYLSLESMRFKGRFVYSIEMDEKIDLEGIKVPSMILQPFVENSIIHGILPQQDLEGKITVKVFEKDKYLNITIEDNGIGVSQSMSRKQVVDGDHKSQGMEITSKRIELIQKISNTDIALEGPSEIVDENGLIKGTYVLLKIPLEHLSI